MENMPECIVVGITFNQRNRNLWTSPNKNGGKTDDLIDFITNELDSLLKSRYRLANFNLLIGHSRTAILSAYALSKRYDYFNGSIACSAAYFEFGDEYQKKIRDQFTDSISFASHKYFLLLFKG